MGDVRLALVTLFLVIFTGLLARAAYHANRAEYTPLLVNVGKRAVRPREEIVYDRGLADGAQTVKVPAGEWDVSPIQT
jgi:hypothetical protein